jgi:thiazole/oxazole-forming peptide maturase SagC family component
VSNQVSQDPALRLAATARLIGDATGQLRIRTGVWNFEEAVVDLSAESEAVGRTVRAALAVAATDVGVVLADHLDPELLPVERANVERLLVDLTQAGLLVPAVQRSSQDAVTAALLGRLVSPYPGGERVEREIALITDCAAVTAHAQYLAEGLRVRLRPVAPETYRQLIAADLTSRVDGYATELSTVQLRGAFADADVVVSCLQRPGIPMLRNLNRVLEGLDRPWINAFIDGPFVTVMGLKSPHTGCFECFEQRALARLEDHVVYHEFARQNPTVTAAGDIDAPMMHWLTVLALNEGYLHAAVGTSRIGGRVMSIHLPTMEIQTQDLLRMPNCPACGRVSRQRIREINFNSRAVVDRVVAEVLR